MYGAPSTVPGVHGGQERTSDALELELQVLMSHGCWEPYLRSSVRVARVLTSVPSGFCLEDREEQRHLVHLPHHTPLDLSL